MVSQKINSKLNGKESNFLLSLWIILSLFKAVHDYSTVYIQLQDVKQGTFFASPIGFKWWLYRNYDEHEGVHVTWHRQVVTSVHNFTQGTSSS
jgi:hypothetical protein